MRRYVVRIDVLGHCVWGDNDTYADTPADARAQALASFRKPLPQSAYAGLSPEMVERVRRLEERAASIRAMPESALKITVTPSRAKAD